ncbi:vWA domain-containing protein [Vallitalea maricola]|uniref:BatA and WFA domain-containing protein n=1 Tax=Vallitalea maricola TaxID=3074433 RepID=A0ACB5UGW0_9FIRM|nr:BatA and WFA domain-containing protein [Vallitalea sp. AN17-2]
MRFSNPYALWGLLLIPLVILMYILRQNFEQKEISSIFLWELASKEDEVNTPWQKLKKNILMILQIIVIIIITLALANPYLYKKQETNNVQLIVIDTSASMNAEYKDGETRLDYAKEMAKEKIDGLLDGTPVTIITIGNDVNINVSNAVSKDTIKKSINNINPTYGSMKIDDNIDFIFSIAKSYEDYEISIISDEIHNNDNVHNYLVQSEGSNVSIDNISTFFSEGSYEVLAKVTNRYKTPVKIHLDIYDQNDTWLKGSEIDLESYESKSILFDNINCEGNYIYGQIKEKDLIAADNKRFNILNKNEIKRIILISEENIFMEKAILASNRYELYKTKNSSVNNEKYDLYIYDSIIPDSIPDEGNLMFLNIPKVDGLYDTEAETSSGMAAFSDEDITRHVFNEKFIVSDYRKILPNEYIKSIANVGEDSIIAIGNKNGRKFNIISFDLHNSDFPLNISFPVLIDNLLADVLGNGVQIDENYHAGENISFEPLSTTEKAFISDPKNNKAELDVNFPITYYDDTKELGVYELIQENNEKEQKTDYITINYNTDSESTIKEYSDELDDNVSNKMVTRSRKKTDFMSLFIILAVIVMLYEWKKYVIG